MVDLILVLALTVLSTLVAAWATARAAKAVGSPRGALRWGLLAAVIFLGLAIIQNITIFYLPPEHSLSRAGLMLAIALAALCAGYVALKGIFWLSWGRTFAPFGSYVAVEILTYLLMLTVIRPHVLQAYTITSPSMSPTLDAGDRIIVNKFLKPKRWDLVVYHYHDAQMTTILCKRIVGFPGERLSFMNGSLYVNGQLTSPPAVLAELHADYRGKLKSPYQDGAGIVLGADEFFVLGDNLSMSIDSRYSGPSKNTAMIGVADCAYWPLTRFHVMR